MLKVRRSSVQPVLSGRSAYDLVRSFASVAPMATAWCWERTARKPVIWRLSMRCMP